MLAKVPEKRSDGQSSFTDLVSYITNRTDEKESPTDELDPSNRRRDHAILERVREHLQGAADHLQATGRIDASTADAIRVRLECARRDVNSDGHEHGAVDNRVSDQVDGVVADGHQRSIATIRNHLESAARDLRQAKRADPDFQARARARRANLAFLAEAAQRRDGGNQRDTIAELLSGSLLGDAEREVTSSGVVCQHNCLTLSSAGAEMTAVSAQNARVKDPVYHVVLSWPSSESPTDDQAFDCGLHAMAAVGMSGHQYVFAIHHDTDNVHLHMTINRVHPDTFNAVYPERDFYKLDRAMRELELRHGWQHDNGPYSVFERNGKKVIDWSSKAPASKGKLPARAAEMEVHGDQESLFSYARGAPRKAVAKSLKNDKLTWTQLHNQLAKFGLGIRPKGRGLAIHDLADHATTPIKASDMHEDLSLARLVKRLGEYQVPADVIDAASSYDKQKPPMRDPAERETRRQERADARRSLRAEYEEYRKAFVTQRLSREDVKARYAAIRAHARHQRAEVRANVENPQDRRAFYSVIAFETLRAKDRLRRQIQRERDVLKNDLSNRRLSYRQWVEREAARGNEGAIGQLRGFAYAEKRSLRRQISSEQFNGFVLGQDSDPVVVPSLGLSPRVRRDGSVRYLGGSGHVGFVDQGNSIQFEPGLIGQEALKVTIEVARSRHDQPLQLVGTPAFIESVLAGMAEHGINIPLADVVQEARRKALIREKANKRAPPTDKRTPRG